MACLRDGSGGVDCDAWYSYEGEDDGDEEDFKLKEQLRRATRCRPPHPLQLCRRCVTLRNSQNAELQKQIEIMQDRWPPPSSPPPVASRCSRHKLENTRLEGRVQVRRCSLYCGCLVVILR